MKIKKDKKHFLYLQGGLGNQLYILAYANFLKTRKGIRFLRLFGNRIAHKDTTNTTKRNVFLKLPEMVGFPLMKTPYVLFSTLMKIDKSILFREIVDVHREDSDKWGVFFDSDKTYVKPIHIHRGYYQSHQYLDEPFRMKILSAVRQLGEGPLSQKITPRDVVIHIRRGDFLKPSNRQTFHYIEAGHYLKGLRLLSEKKTLGNIYLLSDDFEQIKADIHKIEKEFPIIRIQGNTVLQDLAFMTYFQNFVVGNSTFSWWGARLSQYGGEAVVVVPKEPWVRPMLGATPYPDSWIKI